MSREMWKFIALGAVLVIGVMTGAMVVAQPAPPADDAPADAVDQPPAAKAADAEEPSPFLAEPQTPEEFFEATLLCVKLGRPKLARRYLEEFVNLNPGDDVVLALREKHGPIPFLKLALDPQMQPVGKDLTERVNALLLKRAADPNYLDGLIVKLGGTPGEYEDALATLRASGANAVPRILLKIGAPDPSAERDLLVHTLRELGPSALPPLVAALDSTQDAVRLAAINAIGFLGRGETSPHLWKAAFSPNQPQGIQVAARQALAIIHNVPVEKVDETIGRNVARQLREMADKYLRQDVSWAMNDAGKVTVWSWRPDEKTVAPSHVTPRQASLHAGLRFAGEALDFNPDDSATHALFVALALAYEAEGLGWDQPLPSGPGMAHTMSLSAGADVVSDSLSVLLGASQPRGALAALHSLSQVGSARELLKSRGPDSPLIAALNYPDQRVQFGAAAAVLQLDPRESFRDSGRVVAILTRAITGNAMGAGIVVDPNTQRASQVTGFLAEAGYPSEIAPTGRDAFTMATENGDVELIVLHVNTIRWELTQTVSNLRSDSRSANIPIVIYGPEDVRRKVQPLLDRTRLATFVSEVTAADRFRSQIEPFLKAVQAPSMTEEERTRRSVAAVGWLAHIAEGKSSIFDLTPAEAALGTAMRDDALARQAIYAIRAIPSRTEQGRFLEIALSELGVLEENRVAAAEQLAMHIQRYGLLLSVEQVSQLEVAWKSATDPEIKTALASVVGTLKPNGQRVSGRLRQYVQPALP